MIRSARHSSLAGVNVAVARIRPGLSGDDGHPRVPGGHNTEVVRRSWHLAGDENLSIWVLKAEG